MHLKGDVRDELPVSYFGWDSRRYKRISKIVEDRKASSPFFVFVHVNDIKRLQLRQKLCGYQINLEALER